MGQVVSLYNSNWEPYSSYGVLAMNLLYNLSQQGYHVNCYGVHTADSFGLIKHDTHGDLISDLIDKPLIPNLGGIVMGYPTMLDDFDLLLTAGNMLLITGWESTVMPDGWLEQLNRPELKGIVVWAQWNKTMMLKAGVKTPIHVVPLGVSDVYQYHERRARKTFKFLCIGDRFTRKAWDVVAQAFGKAFGDRDDVELIIKIRNNGEDPQLMFPLADGVGVWNGGRFRYEGKLLNIRIDDRDLDELELNELYQSVDCMVFPSRGEGFGLPPREFTATGGVAIVNKWWADDVLKWGYGVNFTMQPAWKGYERFEGLGEWAEPNLDELVEKMKYIVHLERTNPVYLRHLQKRRAQAIRKLYRWDKFAEQVATIWQDINKPTLDEKRAQRGQRKRELNHGNPHPV